MKKYIKYVIMTIFATCFIVLLYNHIRNKKIKENQEQLDKISSEVCPYKIGDTE